MTTKANPKTDRKTASDDKAKLKVIAGGNGDKQAEEIPALEPRYETKDDGVFFIGVRYDSHAKRHFEEEPLRLCDRLDILGRGKDEAGDYYRVLKWRSRGDNKEQFCPLPLRDVGERSSWGMLKKGGLSVSTSRRDQEKLAHWLQTGGADDMHTITHCGGWKYGAYILPGGTIIGEPTRPMLYNGDRIEAEAYAASGTVADWRDSVARLCRGNMRSLIAIGSALAAPLMHLAQLESGGFHMWGESSMGKSTILKAAASVWGHPDLQAVSWNSTELALSNKAAARNDGLMMLDEINQGTPQTVAKASYTLFNGVGKMQGSKDGGNRPVLRWRVFVFSTGEQDLKTFMKTGNIKTNAGQEVRLASIPFDAGLGLGAFEQLNGEPTLEKFTSAIESAAKQHYGAAGRYFVKYAAEHQDSIKERLISAIKAVKSTLPADTGGQVYRVAARFALVAEALEIATDAGITGYEPGEAKSLVLKFLKQWIDANGLENREAAQLIEQVENWFSTHGSSPRFIDWGATKKNIAQNPDYEPESINCAGWRRRDNGPSVYFVNPGTFANEIASGANKTWAAKTLAKAGFITMAKSGPTMNISLPTGDNPRFYTFVKTARSEGE